jgi:hypothetical protein
MVNCIMGLTCCQEARVTLDCKHWAKHKGMRDDIDDKLRFIVEWHLMTNTMGDNSSERYPAAWGGSGARAAWLSRFGSGQLLADLG